jgi:leader peptidase (prepilin peptidase)/N-methyltransferase
VELLTAGLFAGLAARFGWDWALPAYLALFAGLVALSWIDVERLLLPRAIIYPTLILVAALLIVASAANHDWHSMWVAAVCAAGWWMLFWALNFISPRILGYGDVRLAPLLGLGLGWLGERYVILGFFVANLIGAAVGVALIAMHKLERQQRIPYGVFLAAGTAIAIYWGPEVLSRFSNYRL